MRKKLNSSVLVISSVLLVLLLGSCTSLSFGAGYGGNTCDANNDYHLISGVDHPSTGISSVWSSTIRFGENRTKTGFAFFTSLDYTMGSREQDSISYSSHLTAFSLGPAWEFVVSDKFRFLAGVGVLIGSYNTDEKKGNGYDTYIDGGSTLSGYSSFIDARYFFSNSWFLSLRGSLSAAWLSDASYNYSIGGQGGSTILMNDHKFGVRYLATLGIGYNI